MNSTDDSIDTIFVEANSTKGLIPLIDERTGIGQITYNPNPRYKEKPKHPKSYYTKKRTKGRKK